jgi:hypothetical protein
MRHLGTLIAAIAIGPLAWLLLAVGQDRSARIFAEAQSDAALRAGDFVRPLLLLTAAGLLLGLVATLRFSPLGAALVGTAYASSYVSLLVAPDRVLNVFGHHVSVAGHRVDLATPIRSGTAMVLGTLLLVAVVSVHRWRRWPRPMDEPDPVEDRQLSADLLGFGAPIRQTEPELAAWHPIRPEPIGLLPRRVAPLCADSHEPWW